MQAESSKFSSVLFDQGFQIWVGWNWSERHLLVFCINPIVPGFVVYYVNCSWHWQFQCDAYSIITRVSYSPRFGRSEYWVCSTYSGEPRRIHSTAATREASVALHSRGAARSGIFHQLVKKSSKTPFCGNFSQCGPCLTLIGRVWNRRNIMRPYFSS